MMWISRVLALVARFFPPHTHNEHVLRSAFVRQSHYFHTSKRRHFRSAFAQRNGRALCDDVNDDVTRGGKKETHGFVGITVSARNPRCGGRAEEKMRRNRTEPRRVTVTTRVIISKKTATAERMETRFVVRVTVRIARNTAFDKHLKRTVRIAHVEYGCESCSSRRTGFIGPRCDRNLIIIMMSASVRCV